MKEKVNIICLFWVGNYRKRDFKESDIDRLHATVDKYIDRPYDFYCLTNQPDAKIDAIKIPFNNGWPGWWAKVELFRPDLPSGLTLYLDTDTHVVKSLQPILDFPCNDLVMFDSGEPREKWCKPVNKKGWVYRYQAATMLFVSGALSWVYYKFRENADEYMNVYRGEQDMYGVWIPDQPTFPRNWMIKTESLRTQKLPESAIIVTGQGPHYDFRNPSFAPWLDDLARKKEDVCM